MSRLIYSLIAAGIFLAASTANAAIAITSYTPGTEATNGAWSLGWEFRVGSNPITVTSLGVYDDGANGLAESHDVGIYDLSGNLLISGTVNPGDTLNGMFRYTSVAATALSANTNSVVTATTGSENYGYFPTSISFDPAISYVVDRYVSGAGLAFPTNSSGHNGSPDHAWFGGTFGFNESSSVPEPATLAIWGLFAIGLPVAGYRRRLKKSA